MGFARAVSKSQNTGGDRLRKDRPAAGTAGRERRGTSGGTSAPGASPKPLGNAPLPNASNPYANPKANASATAIMYPSQPSKGRYVPGDGVPQPET